MSWDRIKTSITVSLSAPRATRLGFGGILLVDAITNSSLAGFGGSAPTIGANSKYVVVSDVSEATAAEATSSGSVSAALLQDLGGVFAGNRAPPSAVILSYDATDTLPTALAAFNAAYSPSPYVVVPVSHALADIITLAEAVTSTAGTTRPRIVVAQTNSSAALVADSAWTTAISGLSSTSRERLHLSYHSNDAVPGAASAASRFTSFDLDTQSNPWEGPLDGVTPVTGLSVGQREALVTNRVNSIQPYGPVDSYMGLGFALATGRDIGTVVTRDWFSDRLQAAIIDFQLGRSSVGVKLGLQGLSQTQIVSIIETVYAQGVAAGHFLSREAAREQGEVVVIEALPITSTDKANRRLRFRAQLPVLLQTRTVSIDVVVTE